MAESKKTGKAAAEKAAETSAAKAGTEAVKTAETKEAAKAPAKKPAAKTAKTTKTAEKAAPAKKPAAKKAAEPKATIHFQFDGKDLVAKDILDQAVKAYKAAHRGVAVKTIEIYVVANESTAYYVVNGEAQEDFRISL